MLRTSQPTGIAGGRKRSIRPLLAGLASFLLVAAACGGGSDSDDASGLGTVPVGGDAQDGSTQDDSAGGGDTGEVGEVGEAAPADDSADPAPAAAGNGVLIADLCANGQFVDGAISLDDLAGWGLLGSADASVDGGGLTSATAYNDFGALCNIEAADGGDFVTVAVTGGTDIYEDVASRAESQRIGDWDVVIINDLADLVMLHTDADGNSDTLYVNWFPADDTRSNIDEITRVMQPLAEAIAAKTTVDIPRIVAPGTPAWFVCDDTSVGAATIDPAALFATMVDAADVELEVVQEINASFGFTECRVRSTARTFPNVTVQVQDATAELQDTLDGYLAGWPDAVADTVGGVDVAILVDRDFGTAKLFTVLDGTPMEVRVSGETSTDHTESLKAAAELVFAAVG